MSRQYDGKTSRPGRSAELARRHSVSEGGLEPPSPSLRTSTSSWRVCQFRHPDQVIRPVRAGADWTAATIATRPGCLAGERSVLGVPGRDDRRVRLLVAGPLDRPLLLQGLADLL